MSLSTAQVSGAVTSVASVNPVVSASTNSASSDQTGSITIVLSIIGAFLTLASVTVAILQYRIQAKRRLDVERDGQPIEMDPQGPVQEVRGTVAAPP